MSFQIHTDGVAKLAALVGLERPVVVRKTQYPTHRFAGRYTGFDKRRQRHSVALESRMHPEEALRTLIHELGHALQVERLGCDCKAFDRQWWGEMRAAGVAKGRRYLKPIDWDAYNSTPMEREANDLAARLMAEAETICCRAITLPRAELDQLYAQAA